MNLPEYDIAIIGLGPAGATLARLLSPSFSVLALDKKKEPGNGGFEKPCGGLLAPDAQKALASFNMSLPLDILVSPQIFSVRTIDVESRQIRNYQRHYINLDRSALDQWLVSLLRDNVDIRKGVQCRVVKKTSKGFSLTWKENDGEHTASARYLVGADGAASLARRTLFPEFKIKKYTAIQQWFEDAHESPFYSCIFDREATDCYAWGLSKNKYFIFGGAFEPSMARKHFEQLKEKMKRFGFHLENPVKTEACMVLRPRHPGEILSGGDGCFLLGEAAGFISPSSLEGLSYAFDSASMLAEILNDGIADPDQAYFKKTLSLRAKLLSKTLKSPFIFNPLLRRLVMSSGIGSIKALSR